MKKLLWILGLPLLIAVFASGCSETTHSNESESKTPLESSETQTPITKSNTQTIEESIKAAEIYMMKEFTINDVPESPLNDLVVEQRNKEMEPLFAESFTEKPANTSIVVMPLRAAEAHQATVKPENVKFSVYQELENYVDLDYTMDIVLEKRNGDNERVPLKGRLSLVNKNDKWLIQADTFDTEAYKKLIPQNKK